MKKQHERRASRGIADRPPFFGAKAWIVLLLCLLAIEIIAAHNTTGGG